MEFQHVEIPAGDLIHHENGTLVPGNQPIVGLLRGDGIGLDITPAMQTVIDTAVARAYGGRRRIAWCPLYAGLEGLHRYGSELPSETVAAIGYLKVAIKGPFTTPVGGESHVCLATGKQGSREELIARHGCRPQDITERFRSINVRLRQQLDLYACVRPVRAFAGVPSPNKYADQVNMVIFRENTEDVYAGFDFERGSEIAGEVIELIRRKTGRQIRSDSGIGIKPISAFGSERLVRKALMWAIQQNLPVVTLVHKGNIMKFTEGAFCEWGYALAAREFSDRFVTETALWEHHEGKLPAGKILLNDRIADSVFQQIQTRPGEYSVLATPNLNGDYLSDAAIALVGGLGLGPGANLSDEVALFEATHGTAPKYTGQDKVNPGSLILSAEMMLRHLGWPEAADLVLRGMQRAIADRHVTYDLARLMRAEGRTDVVEVRCSGFAQAVCDRMD